MSDTTVPATVPQAQTETPNPTPEPATVPAAESQQTAAAPQESASAAAPAAGNAAAQQTAEQSRQAAEAAEQAEEQAREQAADTLKATVRAYRHGERAYRNGLLDAGKLADLYVHQRLTLGDKRAAAVQALEGALAAYSSTVVDVNRLIGCYQAFRLLAEETGLTTPPAKGKPAPADAVPYGHYRDAWCRLVTRQAKDTPQECWVLLPGLEADCKAAFAKAMSDVLSKAAVEEMARTLLTHHEAAAAEAVRQAKHAAEAKARQAAQEAARQRQELAAKHAAAERAAQEAAQAKRSSGVESAELTANAEAARQELLAKQRETIAAEERERQAKAEAARREKEAAEAAKRQQEAEAKAAERNRKAAEKAAAKGGEKPATVDTTPGAEQGKPEARPQLGNLLKAAGKAGTAKDVADMAAELVTGSEAPDDVLEQLLVILAAHGEMSKTSKRACQAALVVLKRQESPSPARVAAALQPATAEKPEQANATVPAAA
jgi:hypothetical protein